VNIISQYTIKGIELITRGDFEDGIEVFKKAISINPSDAEAWFRKGKAHMALAEYKDALYCYTEASKYASSLMITTNLMIAQSKVRGLRDFGNWWGNTPQVMFPNLGDPKNVSDEYNENGAHLQMFGEFKAAIECYDKALDKYPKNKTALRNKKRAQKLLKQEK
jgi:tetratricopeptide (TPR) repeat protein